LRSHPPNGRTPEIYTQDSHTLAIGDPLQFRHSDNKRNISNARFALVTSIGGKEAIVRLEEKAA
jgi:hypothetical protein